MIRTQLFSRSTIFLACLFPLILVGQSSLNWSYVYNHAHNRVDQIVDMAVDDLGYTYACGFTETADGVVDILIVKLDPQGHLVWTQLFDGPAHGIDQAEALALDASGNVFIAGKTQVDNQGDDFLILKYSANGQLQWSQALNGSANADDVAHDIAVFQPNGHVYATGTVRQGDDLNQMALVKFSNNGQRLWTRDWGQAAGWTEAEDESHQLTLDNNENIWLFGVSDYDGDKSGILLQFDAFGTQQNIVWQYHIAISHDTSLVAWETITPVSLKSDEQGNIYVLTSIRGFDLAAPFTTESFQYMTFSRYEADWDLDWVTDQFAAPYQDCVPTDFCRDNLDNLYVCGYRDADPDSGKDFDWVIWKYDPAGNVLWEQTYAGATQGADKAFRIGVSAGLIPDLYVCGSETTAEGTSWRLLTLDSELGTVRNSEHFYHTDSSLHVPMAMHVHPQGALTMAGYARGTGSQHDGIVLRYGEYNQDGVGVNSTSSDAAFALVPNPANSNATLRWETLPRAGTYEVSLITNTGQRVWHQQCHWTQQTGRQSLDFSSLVPGMYLLLVSGERETYTQPIIIE